MQAQPLKSKYLLLLIFFFVLTLFNSSCVTRKETDYFQKASKKAPEVKQVPVLTTYEPVIKPNDILTVHVTSLNPEATSFFNTTAQTETSSETGLNAYLVDQDGNIEIPLVGRIKVAGLTTRQSRDTVRTLLEKYLQNPTVRIYLENYKVTVLGEVRVPGVYSVRNEKVTVTEALGLAGDLTIFGDRKSIMVIREANGNKNFASLDITRRDIFSSPYYQLHPGDIIYVPAGKGRVASADNFYRIAPIVISALTLMTLIVVRFDN
jgi:polysaccharide biosynthesis/export protein